MRRGRPRVALMLTTEERQRLESLANRSRSATAIARHARIILACADGTDSKVVARRLRVIIKTRGHFPNDEAATKLIWLVLRNITATWARAAPTWKTAMNQFAILYADRFTAPNA